MANLCANDVLTSNKEDYNTLLNYLISEEYVNKDDEFPEELRICFNSNWSPPFSLLALNFTGPVELVYEELGSYLYGAYLVESRRYYHRHLTEKEIKGLYEDPARCTYFDFDAAECLRSSKPWVGFDDITKTPQ